MILLLIPVIVLLIGIIAAATDRRGTDRGTATIFISAIAIIIALLTVLAFQVDTRTEIVQFRAAKETIEINRFNGVSEFERVAAQMKAIEWNEWLAVKQYWNGWWVGLWIPDAVDKLKPIR